MYYLIKNVNEKWRKLFISILEDDFTLKNFLQKYLNGDSQENIYPNKNIIFETFEEEFTEYNFIIVSNRKDHLFYPQYLKNKRFLNLHPHFTYTKNSEENKHHTVIWRNFFLRILRHLEKEYYPIFLVFGKENLKSFYTYPKENIFFDEGKVPEIEHDIQYKPVVIYTDRFTESTKVLINHLLKLKKQPLLNFKLNDR